ncbi:hypothetical protein Bhyg_10961, partial [Pseudolycoriella hygida]
CVLPLPGHDVALQDKRAGYEVHNVNVIHLNLVFDQVERLPFKFTKAHDAGIINQSCKDYLWSNE